MKKTIIITILLALFGCKSGQLSISEESTPKEISVSVSVPSGSKMTVIDPDNGQKKEFVLDSTQDLQFFVKKDSLPNSNIYKFIIIIGSVFLGFLAILTMLEFLKRRST